MAKFLLLIENNKNNKTSGVSKDYESCTMSEVSLCLFLCGFKFYFENYFFDSFGLNFICSFI